MSGYEFSLRQEVLQEKSASVLGNLFRYQRETEQDQRHPLSVMYGLVWSAKQDIHRNDGNGTGSDRGTV